MKNPQKKNSQSSKNTARKPAANKTAKEQKQTVVKPDVKVVSAPKKTNVKSYDEDAADAFIKEVDEEVHNDNLKQLWNKYGLFIILFVVLAVSAAVGFDTIKGWREKQNQIQTENYLASVQGTENAENTIKALEKIASGNNGIYSELARVQIANVLMEQGKDQEAAAMLQSIVDNEELSPRITHMAALKLATYKLDTAPRAEIEVLLQPVVESGDSWAPLAQDILAMAAISAGDVEQARVIYTGLLQNPDISDNFKSRIRDMLSALNDM